MLWPCPCQIHLSVHVRGCVYVPCSFHFHVWFLSCLFSGLIIFFRSMSHAAFCLVSHFYCFRHFAMVLALRSYHQFMFILCRNVLNRCMAGARETETGSPASLNVRRCVVATWWSATSCPVLSARCRHSCTRRRPASATSPGRKRISQWALL